MTGPVGTGIDCVMACLPMIERELRVALRKQRPAKGRLKVAALAAGGSVPLFVFQLRSLMITSAGQKHRSIAVSCLAGLYFVLRRHQR